MDSFTRTYDSVVEKSKIDDVIFRYDSLLHSLLGNSIFGQLVWGGALAGICFTTEVIPLLRIRFFYYKVDFFTTEGISLLQIRFFYYKVDFFTTGGIPLLRIRFLYYKVDFLTTKSVSLLQN